MRDCQSCGESSNLSLRAKDIKMKIKFKNIKAAFFDQLPFKRMFRNFFITRNAWGLFHKNSHVSSQSNKPKIKYNRKITAAKAAISMNKKYGNKYSVYKCLFCDGYHIGKTRVIK